jgi:hypothetical protein
VIFSFSVGVAAVGNAHFVKPQTEANGLRGNLRLDAEPVLTQRHGAQFFRAERFCPHSMSVRFKFVVMLDGNVSNRLPTMCQK